MFDLKVKLDRKEIISRLSQSKENHLKEYADALQGYKVEKWKRLSEALQNIKDYANDLIVDDVTINANMGLSKPIDNSEKYDELINAFRMVKEEILELDFEDAKNIANDSFKWLEVSKMINSLYSNAR